VPAGPLGPECPKCGDHAYALRAQFSRPKTGVQTTYTAAAILCGTATVPAKGAPSFRAKCGVVLLPTKGATHHRTNRATRPAKRKSAPARKAHRPAAKRPAKRKAAPAHDGGQA